MTRFWRQRRLQAAAVGITLVLFAGALALWTRGDDGAHAPSAHRPALSPGAGAAAAHTSGSPGAPSGSAVSGARGEPDLPSFPVSTNIRDFKRGSTTVTFSATGDAYIGGVGYIVEGQPAQRRYVVASPMSVSIRAPYGKRAAMTVQVAADGAVATCSIAIDGVVKVTYTAHGPNRVVACVL